MKAIICGGGTAGHITPGISIAEIIKKKEPNSEILFIGRTGGDENSLVIRSGYNIKTICINGIKRNLSIKNFKTLYTAINALKESKEIIKNFAPDIAIGTGGYVCWPVIRAAQQLHIPTIIHESNATPGLTTKLLASKADKVLLNFPGSENSIKNKCYAKVVGNPLRSSLVLGTREASRRKLGIKNSEIFVFSFGGSGGAKAINDCMTKVMSEYSLPAKNIKHVHACGNKHFQNIEKENPELTKGTNGCKIVPFLENISDYILAADITVCRCGAMTLSEISVSESVPILIPSPNVTDNHQYKNAKLFLDNNAALMIEEKNLSPKIMIKTLNGLITNGNLRKKISSNLSFLRNQNCQEIIYEEIASLIMK